MIPVYSPQKMFLFCYLNTRKRRFYRLNHEARTLENKRDPNETDFAIGFDVDSSGGAVVIDHPTDDNQKSQIALVF
uniref:Transposase n=1 Tax=Caenorhabditis tropicalis TaxID=1561998 RepID=A0A1I7UI03_9PELO